MNLDHLLIRQKMTWDLKTKHIFPELVNVSSGQAKHEKHEKQKKRMHH